MPVAVGRGGVEAHPEGNIFVAHGRDGEQQPFEVDSELLGPKLADKLKLCGQRIGRGEHGLQQRIEQGAKLWFHYRSRDEVVRKAGRDRSVGSVEFQLRIFKQHAERRKRRIAIGKPEHHQLFESCLPIGHSVGRSGKPLGGRLLPTIDGDRWKLLAKLEQKAFDLRGADALAEPVESVCQDDGVDLRAIAGDDGMIELVDQTHGKQRAGVVALLALRVWEFFVQALGKFAAGGKIAEDYISRVAKQRVVQLQAIADRA